MYATYEQFIFYLWAFIYNKERDIKCQILELNTRRGLKEHQTQLFICVNVETKLEEFNKILKVTELVKRHIWD